MEGFFLHICGRCVLVVAPIVRPVIETLDVEDEGAIMNEPVVAWLVFNFHLKLSDCSITP